MKGGTEEEMDELKLFSLLQGIEEKLEKNNELLNCVVEELRYIKSEAGSINCNTDYTYNVMMIFFYLFSRVRWRKTR